MNAETQPPADEVYSRKVLEMITIANEYCLFLEKAEEYQTPEILGFLQKISPLIALKGSLLPEVNPEDEEAIEHYVTEEEWESIFNLLRGKFGSDDEFFFVDLRERSHHDPVKGSLAELFADVYQDMKDFLLLYQKPLRTFKENAVSECRRLYAVRYGYKLAIAQPVLHSLLYPEGESYIY